MTTKCKPKFSTNFSTTKKKNPIYRKSPSLYPQDTAMDIVFEDGDEGNRTPVRRQLDKTFSERSLLFTFPFPDENKHPAGISSFMMHGMGKAYHTHVLYSNHTRARFVDLPGRMGA